MYIADTPVYISLQRRIRRPIFCFVGFTYSTGVRLYREVGTRFIYDRFAVSRFTAAGLRLVRVCLLVICRVVRGFSFFFSFFFPEELYARRGEPAKIYLCGPENVMLTTVGRALRVFAHFHNGPDIVIDNIALWGIGESGREV